MTDKQLTAVEWLIKQIVEQSNDVKLFEKALSMEREQMINAQMDMFLHFNQTPYGLEYLNQREEAYTFAEQYFTDTYQSEQ